MSGPTRRRASAPATDDGLYYALHRPGAGGGVTRHATRAAAEAAAADAPGAEIRAAADAHAVLCSPAGTWAPSGTRIGPALEATADADAVTRLGRMLTWAADLGRLSTGAGVPQVWIVGPELVDALGWLVNPGVTDAEGRTPDLDMIRNDVRDRITGVVSESLPRLERAGWRPRDGWETGGAWVRLERIPPRTGARGRGRPDPASTVRVDVILEPFAWTTPQPSNTESLGILGNESEGWGLPDDAEAARAELGRRLVWTVARLGVLPSITAARTGAAIATRIWREGARRNADIAERGLKSSPSAVLTEPVPIPPLTYTGPVADLEPTAAWSRATLDPAEVAAADRIAVLDTRAAYLASAGMVSFPTGLPRQIIDPAELETVLWFSGAPPTAWPDGLWTVVFPPADQVPEWDRMPPPHQAWWSEVARNPAAVPTVTVTTETLRGLAADPAAGGLGLDWCAAHIALLEGWEYPTATKALGTWQKVLAAAYKAAVTEGDRPMRKWTSRVYSGYLGSMQQTPEALGQYRAVHAQPLGRAIIAAHARMRLRRKAAQTAARLGVWPIAASTDAVVYLVPAGVDPAALGDDDTDAKLTLGRLIPERVATLTDATRVALLDAEGSAAVSAAIAKAFAESPHVERYK